MNNDHSGICRLCGTYGKLTYEHIPPKRAFNDQMRTLQTLDDQLANRSYTKFRRGIGRHSLCGSCNNKTGAWYGTAFADWTRQGREWLDKIANNTNIDLPFHIMPLNVLKQILVMAIAASSSEHRDYQYVRRFLLNKEMKYLPPSFRIHMYFTGDGQPRFEADMVIMKVGAGSNYILAEIALPPFGYCITTPIADYTPLVEHESLYDIAWFSRFDYNVWTEVHLHPPTRETHEPFPLDYRSRSEIDEQFRQTLHPSNPS